MARRDSTAIERSLTRLLPSRLIRKLARKVGFVKRSRKIDAVAFIWTLVLGFGAGREKSLASLRRTYQLQTGTRLVPSAFYDRFTPELVKLEQELLAHALSELREEAPASLEGALGEFEELVASDATVIRLAETLKKKFPATRTNHTKAAAKLHVVMNVAGAGMKSVKITSERYPDGKALVVGDWVKDRLLLFDLGYYNFSLFSRIRRRGGHFISRLKSNANPLIVAEHGDGQTLVGRHLQDVLGSLRRSVLDVDVEVRVKRRVYRGKSRTVRERFRVVGIRDTDDNEYHLYITDVTEAILSAEQVAEVYRLRWTVELLFKEMKSHYRLEEIPTGKEHIVKGLLYATILTVVVSRVLLKAIRQRLRAGQRHRLNPLRWATVLRASASALLRQVLLAAGARVGNQSANLLRMLLTEVVDPNVGRVLLLDDAEVLLS